MICPKRLDHQDVGLINWRGIDGNILKDALLYPVGYQLGKRYPLIVKIYGVLVLDVSIDLCRKSGAD